MVLLVRQGAQFLETWLDGFAFQEIVQEQSCIAGQREELERQRKLLSKKKVGAVGGERGGVVRGCGHVVL